VYYAVPTVMSDLSDTGLEMIVMYDVAVFVVIEQLASICRRFAI
jgi:hypothetical protein